MVRKEVTGFIAIAVLVLTAAVAWAGECDVWLSFDSNIQIEACYPNNRVNIPVYITIPCSIGGFVISIWSDSTSNQLIFDPADSANSATPAADTIGSIIGGKWNSFDFYVDTSSTVNKITVTGLGYGGIEPALAPQSGLLFTVRMNLKNIIKTSGGDTLQSISFGANCQASDPLGWNTYGAVIYPGSVKLACPCKECPRGDINRTGKTDLADLVYFVKAIKKENSGYCQCRSCSGDVNNSGKVDLADLVYFVKWVKRQVEFVPCPDQI